MTRRGHIVVAGVVLALLGLAAWWRLHQAGDPPIATQAPDTGSIASIVIPHLSQRDPRWRFERIAGETFDAVGCTLCCIAMAGHAIGDERTPVQVRDDLAHVGGLTERGWVVWDRSPCLVAIAWSRRDRRMQPPTVAWHRGGR